MDDDTVYEPQESTTDENTEQPTAPEDVFDVEVEITDEIIAQLNDDEYLGDVQEVEKPVEVVTEESTADTEKKKKVKTPKVKKIKDPLIEICKKYFSSMNARNSKYCIFNLDKDHIDKIVLMSNRPKIAFEDYLFQYHPADLSIQIISFKNDDLKYLKERFKITHEHMVLINLNAIRTHINTALKTKEVEVLPIKFAASENNDLYLKIYDPASEQDIVERYGLCYHNWRVIVLLMHAVKQMECLPTENSSVVTDTLTYDDLERMSDQNLIKYKVKTVQYKNEDGQIYTHLVDTHDTVFYLIDGKDIVSVKEYIKKLKTDYCLEITSVVRLPDKHIFYMTKFEDENNIIVSSRPFVGVYPFCLNAKELVA